MAKTPELSSAYVGKPKRTRSGSAATDRHDKMLRDALSKVSNASVQGRYGRTASLSDLLNPLRTGGRAADLGIQAVGRGAASASTAAYNASRNSSRFSGDPVKGQPVRSSVGAIDYLKNSLTSKTASKPTNSKPLGVLASALGISSKPKPATPKTKPLLPVGASKSAIPVAPVVAGSSANKAPTKVTGGGATTTKTTSTGSKQNTNAINSMQDFVNKAKASVSAEDLPKLNALQRELDLLNLGSQRDIKSTRNGVEAQKLAISHLAGQLDQFQQGIQSAQAKNSQVLQQQTGSNYENLMQQLSGNYNRASQSTTSEAERLGLGSQAPVATQGQAQDQNFLMGLAGVDKQHYTTQQAQSGSDFSQLMDQMRNNTQREATTKQYQAQSTGEAAIQEIMQQLRDGSFELNGQRSDIMATQGQRTRELAEGLEEKDYARRTSDQERQLSQRIAMEKLGMDKAQFAAQMQAASAGPSLNDQLDVALKQARLDQMLNPTAKPGKAAPLSPEQVAKNILHRDLGEKGNPASAANMTNLWNIIDGLRRGAYLGNHDGNSDTPDIAEPGKFSISDPVMLQHLEYALKNRFRDQAPRVQQTALEIIRALTGNK